MHAARLLAAVLGAWLALCASMAFVAMSNFRVTDVERLRDADEVFAALDEGEERRTALHYVARELNRHFFQRYDRAQLALAAVALVLLLFAGAPRKARLVVLLLAAGVALAHALYLTPTMVELGREIDFVPRPDPPPEPVQRFYALHGVSLALELAKMALLAALVLMVARKSKAA